MKGLFFWPKISLMNEKQKCFSGMLYDTSDPELCALREKAHALSFKFNTLPEGSKEQNAARQELLPYVDPTSTILSPVHFDYGINFKMGARGFINFNLMVLDTCPVILGDDVFVGPNVSFYTPIHPLLSEERKCKVKSNGVVYDDEYGAPIEVGDGTWIAGSVSIGPGVKIGKRCVIGMGSVVTRDIPDDSLAYGVPCKVVRKITPEDSIYLKKELFGHE